MNKTILTATICIALMAAGSASAAGVKRTLHGNGAFNCERPEAPALPDGDTATAEEMKAAKVATKEYVRDMNRFANCSTAQLNHIIVGNAHDVTESIRQTAHSDRNRAKKRFKKEQEKFAAR